jgi:hypothetical protein
MLPSAETDQQKRFNTLGSIVARSVQLRPTTPMHHIQAASQRVVTGVRTSEASSCTSVKAVSDEFDSGLSQHLSALCRSTVLCVQ